MKLITPEQMQNLLSVCYEKAINGLPGAKGVFLSKGVAEFAQGYRAKYATPQIAAHKLVKTQILKCGTSGFLSGFGGLITLPVAVPANIGSVLYMQLRMIVAIACLGGHDPRDEAVRTMAYLCLAGEGAASVVKEAGIKIGDKVALKAINRLPAQVLIRINQKVGIRLFTTLGTKGLINLVKVVPVAGGVAGAGFDAASTRKIARHAMKAFFAGPPAPEVPDENIEPVEGENLPEAEESILEQ
ncbi:MAG: EcsC family protein [Clostridiales bacterium]|nr:EcsC family protein [Clostridiales bacterium]